MDASLMSLISKTFGPRFSSSLAYVDKVRDLLVVRGESGVELSALVPTTDRDYVVIWDAREFMCDCVDQSTRKLVCKHLIAMLLCGLRTEMVSEIEAIALIQRSKERTHAEGYSP